MYDTNDEMVNYEMLLHVLSYIWQEICSLFVFGTMIRGISNNHAAVINNINSYTKSTELTPYVGIFKKPYPIKNFSTVSFVQNGLCMNLGTTLYKKSLFEVTPTLLYEMVSLQQSGLCSKWFLYEVTVNHCNNCLIIKLQCRHTDEVFVWAHIHRVPVKGVLRGIHGEAFVMFGTQYNISVKGIKSVSCSIHCSYII